MSRVNRHWDARSALGFAQSPCTGAALPCNCRLRRFAASPVYYRGVALVATPPVSFETDSASRTRFVQPPRVTLLGDRYL
ncbi:hypothetical protein [Scytonema sp. HK-05]|uniref:hypothetical protein n=1 Tax=Scytonema sp. HK-05 TaxID=1137095 RepID=UPI001161504B|nr:hypothetical protein [Scytonema sp. HK-05]